MSDYFVSFHPIVLAQSTVLKRIHALPVANLNRRPTHSVFDMTRPRYHDASTSEVSRSEVVDHQIGAQRYQLILSLIVHSACRDRVLLIWSDIEEKA